MSATPNDGGPAFPHPELVQDIIGENGHVSAHRVYHAMPGMSLRDWFAGQALAGLLACPAIANVTSSAEYAVASYNLADLMLAARKTQPRGKE